MFPIGGQSNNYILRNNKMKKIIYILDFSPPHENLFKRFNNTKDYTDYYKKEIGGVDYLDVDEFPNRVFFYHDDFYHILGKEIIKHTSDYLFECWRPYYNISKIYSKEVDGIVHKIFPTKYKKAIKGLQGWTVSNEMTKTIKKEKNIHDVLIILSWPSKSMNKFIANIKPVDIPIVGCHLSRTLKNFERKNLKGFYKIFSIPIMIEYHQEIKILRSYIDYFFCTIKKIRRHLNYNEKIYNVLNVIFGVDFNLFKPTSDKKLIKHKLNIPENKKIILYVGKFYQTKNVDLLIDAYRILKNKRQDIQLVMVGGNRDDEFYDMGIKAGVIMVERISPTKIIKYQQIADIYVLPIQNYIVKNFGGIGSAVMQSLACGVPVISDNLIHFEGGEKEIPKIGRLLENKENLIHNINYILDNPCEFSECRETARKYYDVDLCTKKIIKYFNVLFEQYYGI